MPLCVLTDADVKDLLNNFKKAEIEQLQKALTGALYEYSTSTSKAGCAAGNQPKRTVIESTNGTTTLFMPSTSASGLGTKVVTLGAPSAFEPEENESEPPEVTPQGALTLMDSFGKPFGFLNAEELTAFRTALSSSLLINRRTRIKELMCFGCGKQAYWHVRLALLLRGSTIKKVHFICREWNSRATSIMKRFIGYDSETKDVEGWADTKFDMASMSYGEIDRILKDKVRRADVIFCTTPSTEPLFDHTILTNTEGRKKARLIIAIGSYKPHMIEIPPEVVRQAVKVHGHGHHFHKRAEEGGVIVVDTLACLTETGELIQAGVAAERTVELGELVMLEQMRHDDENAIMDDDTPTATPTTGTTPRLRSQESEASETSIESLSLNSSQSDQKENHNGSGGPPSRSLASVFHSASSHSRSSSPARKSSFSINSSAPVSRKSSISGLVRRPRTGSSSSLRAKKKKQTEKEDEMSHWLSAGNVIYKSVGLGVMDLVVGSEVVKFAREKGVGTYVQNF